MSKGDYLLVGFQPNAVHIIAKEVWNAEPLTKEAAETLYAELIPIGKQYHCRYFRVIAHGEYEPDAQAFELHGLTISDENYLNSLLSGHHVELYPHISS